MEKKRDQSDVKTVRFHKEDWAIVAALSTKLGVTRSEFIKRATMDAASRVLAGAASHYAGGPSVNPHNGGANTFSEAKLRQKRDAEHRGAGVPTARGTPKSKAKGVTTDEQAPAKKRRAM